jgi:hypothetical protein
MLFHFGLNKAENEEQRTDYVYFPGRLIHFRFLPQKVLHSTLKLMYKNYIKRILWLRFGVGIVTRRSKNSGRLMLFCVHVENFMIFLKLIT